MIKLKKMNNLLEVKELSVQFITPTGILYTLDKVSFEIKPKEIVGLVGESGCGKSVTALSILRLLPEYNSRITSGKIIFMGKDLLKLSEKELRQIRGKEISMIFQEPASALNPVYPVGKQIRDLLRLHFGISRKEAKSKAIQLMTTVGISDAEKRYYSYPHELSGGMCQRILIAMAIASNPKLLIADEPTTALDVTVQAQIMDLLASLKTDFDMSILFITHDLSLLAEYGDRIVVMYAGQVIEIGKIQEILSSPLHPYTEALLKAIPRGDKRKKEIKAIPGSVPQLFSSLPKGCRFSNRCEKAFELCFLKEPKLIEIDKDRKVKCHLYQNQSYMS